MESNSNGDFGFERSTGLSAPASNFPICSGFLVSNCASSSQIAADSIASCLKAASVSPLEMVEPFSACWESLASMDGNGSLREDFSSSGRQEPLYEINQRRGIDLAGYHCNGSLVGSAPSLSCLMSARYPDNKNNYSLLESTTISTVAPSAHQLSDSNQGIGINESTTNADVKILGSGKEFEGANWGIADEDEEQNKEGSILSPLIDSRKRKRMPDGISSDLNPSIDRTQRNESDHYRGVSLFSNDMKTKKEENVSGSPNKLNARETKDQNQNPEAQKEEYIHVRARRGQATNSHSLAERVRREKISERMRFLQDLVPGCSKVTGKAVMLDEIINYVQSLQRQVEFLSMKLATVTPDFDMADIVLKNNFPSGGSGSALLGFSPNISRSCHTINAYPLESIKRGTEEMGIIKNFDNTLSSMNPQFVQMEQVPNTWDNELQNVVQMGFVSPPKVGIPPKYGNLKVDNRSVVDLMHPDID